MAQIEEASKHHVSEERVQSVCCDDKYYDESVAFWDVRKELNPA